MVLLDTNIFIIDRFFKRDENYKSNQRFIQTLPEINAYLSIYSLFELCGVASFNLSNDELKRWFYEFYDIYQVKILQPKADGSILFEDWFDRCTDELFNWISKKMTYGDALLLKEAENYEVETIVTWNKKHFEERTEIKIQTPGEFAKIQI